MTFVDYYKQNYGRTIRVTGQALLLSRVRERRAQPGEEAKYTEVLLVPEFCSVTGKIIVNFFFSKKIFLFDFF